MTNKYNSLFEKYANLSIAVLGDYCLDEYLWIDAALNEPSLETGLIAYQCVKRETSPGAAGTIAKNLANLGVGTIYAVGYVGDDGRGFELCQGLDALGINRSHIVKAQNRATFTHTKPWLMEYSKTQHSDACMGETGESLISPQPAQELNRIDIKNQTPTPSTLEDEVIGHIKTLVGHVDAIIVLDHVAEENFGIITGKMRDALAKIAKDNPQLIMYADSRSRIGLFDYMMLKGNQYELCHAVYGQGTPVAKAFTQSEKIAINDISDAQEARVHLAADPTVERTDDEINHACETLLDKTGKPVVCTLGERGAWIYHNETAFGYDHKKIEIQALPIIGQTDVCGAGDMFTSAFISALAAGADMTTAGEIGNTAASICVAQLGTTGYVTAGDVCTAMLKNEKM